ncbi:MAG: hypothetical protein COB09_19140 [Thalassobium sp.]|nr:MAG: hypothetical protein COB09_19140 [Thalassobium sp.]
MKIGELFIALGFDVDDKKLKDFNSKLKAGRDSLLKMSAIATGTLAAIYKFTEGSARAATALRNFNLETGRSIQGLQKWQAATILTNSAASADQVTASFKAMSDAIVAVTEGGGGGVFARLGIDNVQGRGVVDVLDELRANFDKNTERWGYATTVKLMKDVGVDASMINALKLTREEFDKISDSKFLSPESRDNLVKLGDAFSRIKFDLKLFKDQISADLSPKLIEWMNQAVPQIKEFGKNIFAVVDAIDKLAKKVMGDGWMELLLVWGASLALIFAPLASTILLVAAAVNDMGKAIRGLPSLSGSALGFLDKMTDKAILGTLNMMNSDPASLFGGMKTYLEDKGVGKAIMQGADAINDNHARIMTNHITVNTAATDPQGVAREIPRALQEQKIGVDY